jgi:arylsulfatase A-like enzyme
VPLIIASPGQQHRQDIYNPTSCIDLLPTLLHLSAQPVPEWCEGQVLPGLGGPETTGRSLYALEAKTNPKMAPLTRGTITQITDEFKLIHYFGNRRLEQQYELYDLRRDPEEMENRYSAGSATAKDLQQLLETKIQQVNQPFMAG